MATLSVRYLISKKKGEESKDGYLRLVMNSAAERNNIKNEQLMIVAFYGSVW